MISSTSNQKVKQAAALAKKAKYRIFFVTKRKYGFSGGTTCDKRRCAGVYENELPSIHSPFPVIFVGLSVTRLAFQFIVKAKILHV